MKQWKLVAKKIAPILAPTLSRPPWLYYLQWVEIYLAILQGKGAGIGWDLKSEVHAALKLVPKVNPVIFDVGANVGMWTKLFLQKRPDAQIFLFEPDPACRAAIASLGLSNTRVITAAVGRRKETGVLHTPRPTDHIASLYPRKDTVAQNVTFSQIEVPIVCIDDVVEEFQIEVIDFMKIDIEGAELDALHGATASLRAGKIRAIAFEFGCGNVNSRTFLRDFWHLLIPFQFSMFRITPGGALVPIAEYSEELEYFKDVSNYVALRSGA
jgi:FkbM family methyltransferase